MKKTHLLVVYTVLLAFSLFNGSNANAGNDKPHLTAKIPLTVLYVGYDPVKPMPQTLVYYMTTNDRYAAIYKTRMEAFKLFLEKKFTVVKTIDVRDYTASMSDQADVTIMDAGPVKLPADFERPMILMAAMAPNVGLPIGLKFDWYCQCLDGDALNIKTQHEIFNTPNKVNLTLVERPTPGSFFNGFQGLTTPKTMPMWRVVTEGYSVGKPYLIGMVAHGEGFNDSPDAESISGGTCLKNAEAVALGRHGNYFMWGFAGSPDYMTEEANQVFVNTICYIRKFDRKPPIVKKVQIETREGIDEIIYRLDEEVYKKAIISRKEGNARLQKMQQELRDQKAAGKDIGRNNEMFLKMPMTDAVQSFEDYLKSFVSPELYARFGTNTQLYHQYYKDNYEYFYPSGQYSLQLDEDAQKLGISNRQPLILEKCISMLEKNEDPDLARRVLERYTVEKFKSPTEWRNWFNTNKDKLFYTEAGGFKFIVNTYGNLSTAATKPAADTSISKTNNTPTSGDPVAISASLVNGVIKNKKELIINADILQGWHIYAYVSKENLFIQTETVLELPEGMQSDKEWQSSAGLPYPGTDGIFVYEGKASFRVGIDCTAAKAGSVIKCGLYYQVCNDNKCFPPRKKILSLKYDPDAS